MPEKSVISIPFICIMIFFLVVAILNLFHSLFTSRREKIIERLRGVHVGSLDDEDGDVLKRPFMERTIGAISQWLVKTLSRLAPEKLRDELKLKIEKAGNPRGLKPGDILAVQGLLGFTVMIASWSFFNNLGMSFFDSVMLITVITALCVYLPWFILARMATIRQETIRKSLPDIMDLLVISVEAGLAFEMGLLKVIERFSGPVVEEFQKAAGEMQLGKSRKEALKDMADRLKITEVSVLINAIVQSEQLGVGLSQVLRLQSELIREKRQQYIEEQAMKAPVKLLFPLVFFIFPSMLIVLLGPALLNIIKMFGDM